MAENQKNYHANAYAKKKADNAREQRRAAREAVLALLFETEYHEDEAPEAILARAAEARDVDVKDRYIRKEYYAIMEHLSEIDALLGRHAKGWRTDRLSRVSRAVLRLGAYELVWAEKIPAPVAINEAVELAKKYDDPKARAFINGVLNAIKKELEDNGGVLPVMETAQPAEAVEIPAETLIEEPDADPVVEIELTVEEPSAEAAEDTSSAE
ncbi:MAG: transcription antitermination factor NusB [Clostridia bacterium]|nr:transcription antitermination factor NusB [Clostridia bacterium]